MEEQMVNQQVLRDALTYYGFLRDLEIVETEMRKNEPLPTDKSIGTLKAFWNKNVRNETRRMTMTELSEKKNNILNQIDKFKNNHLDADYSIAENKDELVKRINEVFYGDNANISKALFALQFCLDGEIQFENRESVIEEISELLFGNRNTVSDLYNNLKENYIQLYKLPFIGAQKSILKCLGVAALIAVVLPSAAALSVPMLWAGAVAQIGIEVVATVEMAAVCSTIVLGGMLVGTEIAKQIKVKEAKENLRKASPEDLSLLLSIKATLIQYARKTMSAEEIKSVLDDCLKQLNDLRSDAEYLLIVERLDADKSKKKIEICNNFTNRLVSIVGL